MNVTREDLNDTNAIIRVKITPEDYGKNVASTIEKTRKNANYLRIVYKPPPHDIFSQEINIVTLF